MAPSSLLLINDRMSFASRSALQRLGRWSEIGVSWVHRTRAILCADSLSSGVAEHGPNGGKDSTSPSNSPLAAVVSEILNAHDLLGVLTLGAPADEYDPEMKDLVTLIEEGTAITPEVVAGVWHKWFGDEDDEPEPPDRAVTALTDDLLAVQQTCGQSV
jgi:hypothetical protein